MKTVGTTILAAAFILMPWCILPLFSQQTDSPKKVVITKRSVDPDGSEHIETIIKKGKAAENFNAEEYVRNNRTEHGTVHINVEEEQAEGGHNIIIRNKTNTCVAVCADKGAFLGVQQDLEKTEDQPGVAVQIVEGSAAEKSGLQDGDAIISLNAREVSEFDDISTFMKSMKPGDQVRIVYERNGTRASTEATLGQQKIGNIEKIQLNIPSGNGNHRNEKNGNRQNWSWDNYDVDTREKEACLGVYTSATTLDEKKGAQITDFTEESAAREVQLLKGDLILSVNGQAVVGHEELWNEISKFKPQDKVRVEYMRDSRMLQVEATLKACRDQSTRVEEIEIEEDGEKQVREFTLWKTTDDGQTRVRERRVITIRRSEGDTKEPAKSPADLRTSTDRKLKLTNFRAFPNPTGGQLTVEFKGEAVATTLALYDASGRQLFREEMNAFSGEYFQQFDLSEYAKGTVVVQVQQGDKLYSEQIVVN